MSKIMIRTLAASMSLAASLSLGAFLPAAAQTAAPAVAQPTAVVVLEGAERDAALARANQALNAVQTMQGRFVQTAPGGARSTGQFYLQKPGRLRFEYDPPATMLIISDGRVVSLRDRALRTTDRTPLASTPLNFILRQNINLARDVRITRVSRWGNFILVTARDRSGGADGQITMHFEGPTAQLRSWEVVDSTGSRTRITLSNITTPASLDRRLFRMEDQLENRPGGRT